MLEIKNLTTCFSQVNAVDNVSFSVDKNEIFGIVGESGSGKSTIALSLMRLIGHPGKIIGGQVLFYDQDLLRLSEEQMIKIRGAKIAMIFQDPFSSLNPVLTIGEQIEEAIILHQGLDKRQAEQKTIEMLELVQIKDAKNRIKNYPHQFSGGMRQRVMIAMALACQPDLLIADEPTTALDVTIQAEILKLLKDLQNKLGFGIVYITHNFGIVRTICDRVMVMHKGKVVEQGSTVEIMQNPKEEYTKKLIGALTALTPNPSPIGRGEPML